MDEIIQGLLSPEQYQQTRERANIQGLMNLGQALIQAGQGGGGRRVSTLAGLGMAAPAYAQGRQQAFDQTLQDILRRTQVQDLLAKRREEEQRKARMQQIQSLTPALYRERMGQVPTTIPTETYEDVQTTTEGVVGLQLDPERLRQLAMLGPEGRSAALEALQFEKAMAPERKVYKPGDVITDAEGNQLFRIPEMAPESIRTLQYLMQNPELLNVKKSIAAAGAPTTNVSFKDTSKEFSGTLGDQIKEIRKGGSQARSTLLPNVQTMKVLLDEGVRTGFGQPTLAKLQQAAQLVNPNFKFEKNIAGIEAFESAATQVILPQVKQLGVNPTDTDLKFIERGSPTLAKSTEGNRLMLDALELKAQRDIFLQNWVADWQSKNVNLIESSAVRADAKLQQDLNEVFANNPLFAPAAERLRQRYQAIGGGSQVQSKLRNSPLFKQ